MSMKHLYLYVCRTISSTSHPKYHSSMSPTPNPLLLMHSHHSKWHHSPTQKPGCHPCLLPSHLPYLMDHQDLPVESPKYISHLSTTLPLCCPPELPVITFLGLGPWNSQPFLGSHGSPFAFHNTKFHYITFYIKNLPWLLFYCLWNKMWILNPKSRATTYLSSSGIVAAYAIPVYLLIVPSFTGPSVPVWLMNCMLTLPAKPFPIHLLQTQRWFPLPDTLPARCHEVLSVPFFHNSL